MSITQREQQIMSILEQDPMVSQEQLAKQLSITRSAVAVHISNLIKKGKIIGRGYVLAQPKVITVLGAIRTVITSKEQSQEPSLTVTGLGYQLTMGLAKLKEHVLLLSAVGTDLIGRAVLVELQGPWVDQKMLIVTGDRATGLVVEINDKEQLSSLGALELITREVVQSWEHAITTSQLVAIDGLLNMSACSTMLGLCNKHGIPSVCVLNQVKDITPFFSAETLKNIDSIILMKSQLMQLGITETSFEELTNLTAIPIHANGRIIVLCEQEGVLLITKNNVKHISLVPGQRVKSNFVVGFIYGLSNGYPINQAIRIGLGNFQQIR